MGDVIDISRDRESEPDPASMGRAELLACLEDLRAQLAALDAEEPEDMECEAYEDWGARHEALEDLVDEVMDRLDELD